MYLPIGEKSWNLRDHEKMMLIPVLFALHLAIALVVQAVLAFIVLQVKKRLHGPWKTESSHLLESDDENSMLSSP